MKKIILLFLSALLSIGLALGLVALYSDSCCVGVVCGLCGLYSGAIAGRLIQGHW